ncbi:MAG: hypothetical protein JF588_01245 [Caulobacterales bacterium]|nr:hypothetical protein [Caulobacterales bacterium]
MYISRTSFPSLFAAPVEGFQPSEGLPGDLRRHEHNALLADLQKTALARLVAYRPTHIIFDFIDERFDLLCADSTLVTDSAELHRSGYRAQPVFQAMRSIPRLSGGCERLWLEGLGEFVALLRATPLAQASLILHAARWAETQRLANGRLAPLRDVELLAGRPVEIADYNALLARQDAAFAEAMPAFARVEARDLQVADAAHQWGLSPFHYVPAYYAEIRRRLEALGLEGAFSAPETPPSTPSFDARPDAPSAPAA